MTQSSYQLIRLVLLKVSLDSFVGNGTAFLLTSARQKTSEDGVHLSPSSRMPHPKTSAWVVYIAHAMLTGKVFRASSMNVLYLAGVRSPSGFPKLSRLGFKGVIILAAFFIWLLIISVPRSSLNLISLQTFFALLMLRKRIPCIVEAQDHVGMSRLKDRWEGSTQHHKSWSGRPLFHRP